jgi:uncharacterized protein YndB with AHSA1/START domain
MLGLQTMKSLFVDLSVEINAPASRVWEALTQRQYTDHWAPEFSSGGPALHIESTWGLDDPVLWKDAHGNLVVEGQVTALIPQKLLRFTVFDVRGPEPEVTSEDGITYKLTERDGKTRLWVSQGDFSSMDEGEKYRGLSAQVWDRVLLRVKRFAEKEGSPT